MEIRGVCGPIESRNPPFIYPSAVAPIAGTEPVRPCTRWRGHKLLLAAQAVLRALARNRRRAVCS
jgi:hypothetical protein